VTVVDANALDCRICWYPLNPPIFQVRARSHPPTFQMFLSSPLQVYSNICSKKNRFVCV
jgi:hypothetical protein